MERLSVNISRSGGGVEPVFGLEGKWATVPCPSFQMVKAGDIRGPIETSLADHVSPGGKVCNQSKSRQREAEAILGVERLNSKSIAAGLKSPRPPLQAPADVAYPKAKEMCSCTIFNSPSGSRSNT
jgi:hypothetical protein